MEDDVADGDDGAISIRYLTKPADIFDLRLSPTHWSSYLSFSHSHKAIFTTTRQPTVQLISISQFMTVIKISVLKSISGLITHPQPPSAPSVRPSFLLVTTLTILMSSLSWNANLCRKRRRRRTMINKFAAPSSPRPWSLRCPTPSEGLFGRIIIKRKPARRKLDKLNNLILCAWNRSPDSIKALPLKVSCPSYVCLVPACPTSFTVRGIPFLWGTILRTITDDEEVKLPMAVFIAPPAMEWGSRPVIVIHPQKLKRQAKELWGGDQQLAHK